MSVSNIAHTANTPLAFHIALHGGFSRLIKFVREMLTTNSTTNQTSDSSTKYAEPIDIFPMPQKETKETI